MTIKTGHWQTVRPIDWCYNQSMGRTSKRTERREQLVLAYARVLADQGQAGATIAAVALEAGVAPGLVHHYFAGKHDLQAALLEVLVSRFRGQMNARRAGGEPLATYADATLGMGARADLVAARAWVALLAEAQSDATLFHKVRRLLDTEVEAIVRRGRGRLDAPDACAVLSYVVGALIFGAFAPRKSPGFAAPRLALLIDGMRKPSL